MQVIFPPFVDLPATLIGARSFGAETVTLDFSVKNKAANIHLSRAEAESLVGYLRALGVGVPTAKVIPAMPAIPMPQPAATPKPGLGTVVLPKK
jgi:hypothetical protein